MLRTGASRSIIRSLNTSSKPAFKAYSSPIRQQSRSQLCTISHRPQAFAIAKPLGPKTLALARWQTSGGVMDKIDKDREQKIGEKKLPVEPELVSNESSTVPMSGGTARDNNPQPDEPDMMAGIKSDLQTIRDTFSLEDVPTRAYYMSMAGVIPYAVTSLGTVYCAFEINQASESGSGFFLSANTAEQLLHVIEPIQVGYGAVILSFLGAIHWGFEWAQYGGVQGYPRYAIGVVTTAVAWPTLLFPVEYALITQFLAFTFLYYTDVRAKTRGWTPPWYGIYRFVLTFIVGSSIVISLIGRGQIADRIGKKESTAERIKKFGEYHETWGDDEQGARAKRRELLPDESDEDEEDEDEEEDD